MDSGLEGRDDGVVDDDKTVPDGRRLVGTIVDCTVLERVDAGGAGTLEADEYKLLGDTLEVVDGGWCVDIESPVIRLVVGDV
jgi:hypothetical protein